MEKLAGIIRAYPWGSKTMLPELRGEEPTGSPQAELWYGAHPASPALLPDGTPLDRAIAADPEGALGARVRRRHGDRLPFLLKLLAAAEPLSLQAHPSLEQAREGWARENAAGIPLGAGERNYKDDNHKPELIVALTSFRAMAGFRPLARTRELFAELGGAELGRYLTMLEDAAGPEAEERDLRALFTTWITIPPGPRAGLLEEVVPACRRIAGREDWMGEVARTVGELAARHPGDVGILGALLLNHLTLRPGEAIFLAAGELHAYVHGLGVEIMANSDNVLRGGLTSKYVDVPELVRVLGFRSLAEPRVRPRDGEYPVPADEFRLSRHELAAGDELGLRHDGPGMVLCTRGEFRLAGRCYGAGDAAWVPARDAVRAPALRAGGEGAEVFRARC